MIRRYLYHCTTIDHGSMLTVRRQTPRMPANGEPVVPRLCVCPSVAECFAARLFVAYRDVLVYRTPTKQRGVTPVGVWDHAITRERWVVPPARLDRWCVIPADVAAQAQEPMRLYHFFTGKQSSFMLRVASLLAGAAVLEKHSHDWVDSRRMRFVTRLAKKWGVIDPVTYILGKAEVY